jgi:tetratricopeptide (TPR) repeat protein
MAKSSIADAGEIVSETLANIYAQQGNYHKAINAFEKLSLKYPEKSHLFAARIRELKGRD